MSTTDLPRPRPSVVVILTGLATIVIGATYTLVGATLVYAGIRAIGQLPGDDQMSGWAPVLAMVMGFVIVFGIALLVQGLPQVIVGMGVLRRRQWARIVTLVFAVLAALWGVALLLAAEPSPSSYALGVVQVLYGVLTWVVLIAYRREFSRGCRR